MTGSDIFFFPHLKMIFPMKFDLIYTQKKVHIYKNRRQIDYIKFYSVKFAFILFFLFFIHVIKIN